MSDWRDRMRSRAPGPSSGSEGAREIDTGAGDLRMRLALQRRAADRRAERAAAATPAAQSEAMDAESVQERAQSGVKGAGDRLPHLDRLQQAFGDHDLSDVRAHVGGDAAKAARGLNAQAYAHGDKVAFGQSPDLHTAAHEAAHIVQQRAGRGPAGVGQVGDAYERHADAVADAIVAGRSAKPLLDQMAGQGASRGGMSLQRQASAPVQLLHGDLSVPSRVPGTQGSVEQAATAAHDVQRDANFNDAKKVEIETRMANKILNNPGPALPVAQTVSRNILTYIEGRKDTLRGAIHAATDEAVTALGENFHGNTAWWGRLVDEQLKPEDLLANMMQLLQGAGSLHQHLFVHHQFMDKIFEKDLATFTKAQLAPLVAKFQGTILGNKEGGEKGDAKAMRTQGLQGDAGAVGGASGVSPETAQTNAAAFADRGRVAPGKSAPASGGGEVNSRSQEVFGQTAVPQTASSASGTMARPGEVGGPQQVGVNAAPTAAGAPGIDQQHERGVDRWTLDESAKFMQEARIVLNMPLGAGISGTTTDLLTIARTMGITGNNLHLYAVGCVGGLEGGGAHTFHEIARACQMAGVPYKDGDYRSFFPPEFLPLVEPELKELEEYEAKKGQAEGPAAAAAAAPPPAA
jgi:hypothetical protein